MTPTLKQLNAYIRTLKDQLGLKDWEVTYDPNANISEGCKGECTSAPNRKEGGICFVDSLWSDTPEFQREAFVHELIHMHTRDARNVGRDLLYDSRILGQGTYQAVFYALDTALERAVDGIAHSVAVFLPLPPWTKR